MRKIHPVLLSWILASSLLPLAAKEHWVQIQAPTFTLYADCDAHEARDWAARFEEFESAMKLVLNVAPTQLQPVTIVMFRDRETLTKYVPKVNGKRATEMASFTRSFPRDTIILTNRNWDDDETRTSLYGAGTYWFLNGYKNRGPDWFQGGMAEAFKTFTIEDGEAIIGKPSPGVIETLRSDSLLPLPELFRTHMDRLEYRGDRRTERFFTESWLLVHYLIFGRDKIRGGESKAPKLADFISAIDYGIPAESAFRQVFGTDYDEMLRRLDVYLHEGRYAALRVKTGTAAPKFVVTELKQGGEELAEGFGYFASDQREIAKGRFYLARQFPEAELAANEALAEVAMLDNNAAEARDVFTRADQLGSKSFRVPFFFGEELVSGQVNNRRDLPRFEAKAARAAANRYEQAINRYPEYLPSYERLALLMPSVETYSDDDRRFLNLGVKMDPGNAMIHAGLGVWEMRNGKAKQGEARLKSVLAEERVQGWARFMAQRMMNDQATGGAAVEARKLLADGKLDEAEALVNRLLREASDDAQRAALVALRTEIGQTDLVTQAEKQADSQEWETAATMAQNVLDTHPPDAVKQRAAAVLARAAAKK